MSHYDVLAPEIVTYEYFDGYTGAPEYWHPFVDSILAHNAKEAIRIAMKTDEFKPWIAEARGDGINPFKGVKANRSACAHGYCWGCFADDGLLNECAECGAESTNPADTTGEEA